MPSDIDSAMAAIGDAVQPSPSEMSPPVSDHLAGVCRAATLLNLPRGTTLYSEGEESSFVYLVEQGIVRVSSRAEAGHRQILAFRIAGDMFGFPDCGRYANTADTATPARIYCIAWSRVQEMMLEEPQLQSHLFEKMTRYFHRAQARIAMLGQQNISERLAACLLDLMQVGEFFEAGTSLLTLPMNRFDLADFLGTAPESAARAFAKLEKRGLIRRTTPRAIQILDAAGLQTMRHSPRPEITAASQAAQAAPAPIDIP